ncbi:MAG: hypothetical protein SGPRY_013661, partial [Prymnesium sp.]
MAYPMGGASRRGQIGVDHLEHVGGRDRYIERMLAGVQPVIKLEAPVACFDGGKRGTPRPTSHAHKPDEYTEVREAWRRIITSKPAVDSNRKKSSSLREGSQLAKDISRNKKMAYKQQQIDQLHASELQHLQRRIQHNHTSITERKKNNQQNWSKKLLGVLPLSVH